MTDDTLKNLLAQLRPLADLERAYGVDTALARLAKEAVRDKRMFGEAFGAMEELRRNDLLSTKLSEQIGVAAAFQNQLDLNEQIALLNDRFKLPELTLATKLMETYRASHASELFKQYEVRSDYLRRATEAIRSPWIDMQQQMRSFGAFADLQSIGFALQNIPTFDDRLTELLRNDLGDWRERIVFPKAIFDDATARSTFYIERGLDPALTSFPQAAFDESLDIARLRDAPPPLVDAYVYEEVTIDGLQEAAFARTNAAHDKLQRFETQLRQYIDRKMKLACGENWVKNRVSDDMRRRWNEKREKARSHGEADHPLIAYADFTDYEQIITQRNNWREVFEPVFRRSTYVTESFQRLYPIRICTMHARMITQDDELYLHVEIKRILASIAIN